jgi:hypothetical protein
MNLNRGLMKRGFSLTELIVEALIVELSLFLAARRMAFKNDKQRAHQNESWYFFSTTDLFLASCG